jgi:hypothetical protein
MTRPFYEDDSPTFETRTLQWMKLASRQVVDAEGIHYGTPQFINDFMTHTVMRLTAKVLTERLPDRHYAMATTVTFEHPATTWQMFKSRHADSWWLRWLVDRRPVRMATQSRQATAILDISDYLAYPHQTRVIPEMGSAVRVPVITETWRMP